MGGYNSLPQLRVPEPIDGIGDLSKVLQLKSLMQNQQYQAQSRPLEMQQQQQQLQQQQIATQNAQMDQADQLKFRQAFQQSGGDPDKTIDAAAKMGVGPKVLTPYAQAVLTRKNDLLSYNEKQLAFENSKNDLLTGHVNAILAAPDAQIQGQLAQTVQQSVQQGLIQPQDAQQMGQMSQLPPDQLRQQLGMFKLHLQGDKVQIEDRTKASEVGKNNAQASEAGARQQQINAEMASGGTGAMADAKYRQLIAQQKQGQPISAGDQAWVKAYEKQKTLVPTAQINLQSGLLSDAAKQMAADNYAQTGALPSGLRSPALSSQILNTAAGGPNGVPNVAANKASYQADAGSLKSLQKNFDQVTAFENTAGKNLDVFLNTAKKMIDSGSPWVNKPLRSIAAGALGSEDQAAVNAARVTALTEISKVLNSSNAAGVLSDSARHEVSGLIGDDASLKQIYAAANILKQDMANRHQAYAQQISDIHTRTAGGASGTQAAPAGSLPPGATHIVPGKDGKNHYTNAQGTVDLGIAP